MDQLDDLGALPWWAPPEVDPARPSASRVYDYLLGGSHNFAADRELAGRLIAAEPNVPLFARFNRAFLDRAVRFAMAAGVRQFLDLGSGIPTVGNVHEVARRIAPDARVVYVDVDPVAVAHSRLILAGDRRAGVVHADIRDAERVLADPVVRRLVDLTQPLGLLMVAVLHFLPDSDDPVGLIGRYRAAMAPGSQLVISHASAPRHMTPGAAVATAAYARTSTPLTLRSLAEIEALFAGFEMVEPGVCRVADWRPEPFEEFTAAVAEVPGFAGVGRRAQ
jgi:hypothetical protein